jgi:hypothetical protein
MPLDERRRRAEGLRSQVESDDVTKWFETQVADMLAYDSESPKPFAESEELPPNIVPLTATERATSGA